MTREELIAKLEAAEEGSQMLDELIAPLIGWRCELVGDESRGYFVPRYKRWYTPSGIEFPPAVPPKFTTSIDAALTLVPEGAFWGVGRHPEEERPDAVVTKYKRDKHLKEWEFHEHGSAPTAPLALCIAALKARAAT